LRCAGATGFTTFTGFHTTRSFLRGRYVLLCGVSLRPENRRVDEVGNLS